MTTSNPKFTDLELEQVLLGSLIKNPNAFAEITVKAEDFFWPIHAELFTELARSFAEKQTVSIASLGPWADALDPEIITLDGFTVREYLKSLPAGVMIAMTHDIIDFAFQIADLSRKRNISDAMEKAAWMLESSGSSAVLAQLHKAISNNTSAEGVKSQAKVHDAIRAALILPPTRYSTGLNRLDKALGGGLYAGFTYGFAGEEKAGKTTLAHTISYQLDCKHLYVAMEMGSLQIEQRNIARELGINSLAFLENAPLISESMKTVQARENIHYLDLPGGTKDEILFHLVAAAVKLNIKGFIIDYWQLIGGQQRGETEEKHLRGAAQDLANFARKQGLWCILLAQLGKGGELFGGNGLKKACDQLFMIEACDDIENCRYLRMDATRYTMKADVGSPSAPALGLDLRRGPHFYDPDTSKLL